MYRVRRVRPTEGYFRIFWSVFPQTVLFPRVDELYAFSVPALEPNCASKYKSMQLIFKFLSRVKHVPEVQVNYSIKTWGQSVKWFLSYDRISNLLEYPIITQEPLDQFASHIYILFYNQIYYTLCFILFPIHLYNKALRSHIFVCMYVSYGWPNGWTEWAEIFWENPWLPWGWQKLHKFEIFFLTKFFLKFFFQNSKFVLYRGQRRSLS